MNIFQQSSKAQDRTLGTWYIQIEAGTLKLPRFQRFEAWDRSRVVGFLNTIVQNLPVGVTLLLQVGDKEQFISRYIVTAPETGTRVVAVAADHLAHGKLLSLDQLLSAVQLPGSGAKASQAEVAA